MLNKILFPEGDVIPQLPINLQREFPHIATDQEIHGGWPHIKGTRILAIDIFRAQVKGYSFSKMIMDFKEMGITVSEKELLEAFRFIVEWLRLDAQKASKISE